MKGERPLESLRMQQAIWTISTSSTLALLVLAHRQRVFGTWNEACCGFKLVVVNMAHGIFLCIIVLY